MNNETIMTRECDIRKQYDDKLLKLVQDYYFEDFGETSGVTVKMPNGDSRTFKKMLIPLDGYEYIAFLPCDKQKWSYAVYDEEGKFWNVDNEVVTGEFHWCFDI